jgi:hypothetical protein
MTIINENKKNVNEKGAFKIQLFFIRLSFTRDFKGTWKNISI